MFRPTNEIRNPIGFEMPSISSDSSEKTETEIVDHKEFVKENRKTNKQVIIIYGLLFIFLFGGIFGTNFVKTRSVKHNLPEYEATQSYEVSFERAAGIFDSDKNISKTAEDILAATAEYGYEAQYVSNTIKITVPSSEITSLINTLEEKHHMNLIENQKISCDDSDQPRNSTMTILVR